MGSLYIGTSGYSYKEWRGIFYPKGVPQKAWLTYYAERFNTLELNATFYRHFEKSVFEGWAERTPEHFRFTVKAPREITHKKRLRDIDTALQQFLESTSGLGEKLALILWQFPASFHYADHIENLIALMERLPQQHRYVVEFRHESWFQPALYDLLEQHRAGFVINDSSEYSAREVITGGLMYVRFHGPEKLYSSSYSEAQLATWAAKIRPQLASGDVYVYFNNTMHGDALENAVTLREMLTRN